MEWDPANNKLLFAFMIHAGHELDDEEREWLQIDKLVAAGLIAPAAAPARGYVLTAEGNTTLYVARYMQRRTDPALENGVPVYGTVDGVRCLWIVDERGNVRAVPTEKFDGIDPKNILAQCGWRFATQAQADAAQLRIASGPN